MKFGIAMIGRFPGWFLPWDGNKKSFFRSQLLYNPKVIIFWTEPTRIEPPLPTTAQLE